MNIIDKDIIRIINYCRIFLTRETTPPDNCVRLQGIAKNIVLQAFPLVTNYTQKSNMLYLVDI